MPRFELYEVGILKCNSYDSTEKFFNEFKKVTEDNLDESYILGESALSYDIKDTFASEQLFITILTVVSMMLIIGITFKSLFHLE